MARPVVLLTGKEYYHEGWLEQHWPQLLERCDVRLSDGERGPELDALLAEADVILPRRFKTTRQVLEKAPRLRGIVMPGVGIESVDKDAATELGIVLANSPGNIITVAETTILQILALAKDLVGWMQAARDTTAPTSSMHGMELYQKTLGVVGFGRIGRYATNLARAFGMKVLAYDPYVDPGDVAERVSLEELLRRSDFVSLHVVLTPETYHMIGAEQFKLMKPTARIINTSRGSVIDEPALIEALRAKTIAGAALDVFEQEPPAPDNPLLAMPNVIGTPHGLSHTEESFERCASLAQQGILALIEGRLPENTVNRNVQWRVLQESAIPST
jgi:D-3-phosphoglycerate dehydrogenase